MVKFPDVTIGIITYKRSAEIRQTVEALADNLTYSGTLHYVIADDSSPGKYTDGLKRLKLFKDLKAEFVTTEKQSGWGANANNLLRHTQTEFLFMLEDDYVLQRPLNLDTGVALMEARPRIGMLRYRGTAGTRLVYHQMEADVSEHLPDYREGEGGLVPGKLTHFLIDGGSPDLWIYSNGPHLKRRLFHTYYGAYPEGRQLGATEEAYAHTVKNGMRNKPDDAPWVAILPEWVSMRWAHIGQSYQGTEVDIGDKSE